MRKMRKYEGTTRLRGLGIREGIKAKNLKVGDVLVWNDGETSLVKEITFSKTRKTLTIVEECKGQDHTRRLRVGKIVVVKELNQEVEAVKKQLAKDIERVHSKMTKELPTNKEEIIKELEAEGLVLGCWSSKIGNLSKHNLKKIIDEIRYHSATDVVVRLRGKECVVSIDFVDNEVDFTLYTKAEYISRYGSEKFEEEF